MSSAPRYTPRYNVADYQLWEGDWELWDGVAIAMTPSPFGGHSRLSVELSHRFASAIEATNCDATVLSEIDWIVSDFTVLRPDVLIVCGREPERHVEETPPVVVEVLSNSTRDRDLNEKQAIYRQQGVAYYITVDPENAKLLSHQLNGEAYETIDVAETMTLEICDSCKLEIPIAKLFR